MIRHRGELRTVVCVMGRAMEEIDIKTLDSIGAGLGLARVTVDCDKKKQEKEMRRKGKRGTRKMAPETIAGGALCSLIIHHRNSGLVGTILLAGHLVRYRALGRAIGNQNRAGPINSARSSSQCMDAMEWIWLLSNFGFVRLPGKRWGEMQRKS